MAESYYIYIMTNRRHGVFYTGVTNDLKRRAYEHKAKLVGGVTARYLDKLVYFEVAENPDTAIAREKQIKAGPRRKKLDLIEEMNPSWVDLATGL
jgi:putative endonuclease